MEMSNGGVGSIESPSLWVEMQSFSPKSQKNQTVLLPLSLRRVSVRWCPSGSLSKRSSQNGGDVGFHAVSGHRSKTKEGYGVSDARCDRLRGSHDFKLLFSSERAPFGLMPTSKMYVCCWLFLVGDAPFIKPPCCRLSAFLSHMALGRILGNSPPLPLVLRGAARLTISVPGSFRPDSVLQICPAKETAMGNLTS